MTTAYAVGAVQLLAACVLAWAALHKLAVLRRGAAAAEPLIAINWRRRRHPRAYLATATCVEVAAGLTAVAAPRVGLSAAAVLMVLYAWELRRLPPRQDCNCFGSALGTTRSAAQFRNILIAGACAAGAVLLSLGVAEGNRAVSPWALALAAIVLAVVAAQVAAARILNPQRI